MRARPIRGYLIIGYDLRYLMDVTPEHLVYGERRVLDTVKKFVEACAENGLGVTARAAKSLYDPFVQQYFPKRRGGDRDDVTLTIKDVALLRDVSSQIQVTMLAEAQAVFAHVTAEKRFSVHKLLDDVSTLMAPEIYSALPDVARYDFGQAGRCIAFELPTAAAFHLMRGTEDVLKFFYCSLVEEDRVSLMWGPMVADLRRKIIPSPSVLLNILDNLRSGFRNPTQHPEKIYDIEEAQDLLALSIDAVNRMISYLKRAP